VEANVSRLYGHSSASGANFVGEEVDCLQQFEARLIAQKLLSKEQAVAIRQKWAEDIADMARIARDEPLPDGSDIYKHIYSGES
jgi:2-oxoisovalerate dehydrogenase E1 component alpha subunit